MDTLYDIHVQLRSSPRRATPRRADAVCNELAADRFTTNQAQDYALIFAERYASR